jgi:hypothetical protein
LAVLIERAVDLLIDQSMKRRFAQTRQPKTGRSARGSQAQPRRTRGTPAKPQKANSSTVKPHTAISSSDEPHAMNSSTAEPRTTRPRTTEPHIARPHVSEPHTADSGAPRVANASVGVGGHAWAARMAESSLACSASVRSSRYIPRAVVRAVHQRDAGQCTFVSVDGKRCSERGFLELHHHYQPYARGGEATVENLRLVCRAHNALFAERDFGRAWMRSKRAHTGEASAELGPQRVQV